jgi:hypothetical protein
MLAKGVNLGRLKLEYLCNSEEVTLIPRQYVDLFRHQRSIDNTYLIPKYVRKLELFYLNSNYSPEEIDQIISIY